MHDARDLSCAICHEPLDEAERALSFPPYDRVMHYKCWRSAIRLTPVPGAQAPGSTVSAAGATPTVHRRYLVVVRRNEPRLAADLRRDFAGLSPQLAVIEDRRWRERRTGGVWPGPERRRTERRHRAPQTWEDLGFLLTISTDTTG